MEETELNIENDSKAVPFDNVREILTILPYGNQIRVMVQFLAITGCRISELDNMHRTKVIPSKGKIFLFWTLGKNQTDKPPRKIELPKELYAELIECRKNRRTFLDRLFSMKHDSFRRLFNRDVRPLLSPAWREKQLEWRNGEPVKGYVLKLKGLRKNFQTLKFAKELDRWNSPDIALELASKDMRHSTTGITIKSYIENFENLDITKYIYLTPADILRIGEQKRLIEFSAVSSNET